MNRNEPDIQRPQGNAGFSLVELLLVVAIMGVLATVVVVNLSGRRHQANVSAARTSIKAIETAVTMYETDTGKWPSDFNALMKDDGSPSCSGPYFRGRLKADPWGTPFAYSKTEKSFEVRSAGKDTSLNTDDDILGDVGD